MIPRRPGIALLYHDVVAHESADSSGNVTDGSWRYKLSPEMFRKHLRVIAKSSYQVSTLPATANKRPLLLTFDDGGVSCAETVAPLLDEFGMRGHFFVITGRLGEEGYVSRKQVRDLASTGHHIGSHTVTHANLRELSSTERRQELQESKQALENLLGKNCGCVSIPGGFADRAVIADAFDAGYEYVFVSEPRYLSQPVGDDALSRWNIWHDTTTADLREILNRTLRTRFRVQGRWYALKMLKRTIGQERFERLRRPFVLQD